MLGGFQRFGRHAGVSMLALLAGLSAQAADNNEGGSGIQEVVVTAQLRKQSAEDVPIAMQVVGAEQIEAVGATDIHDLQTFVPGLTVTGSQTEPHFSLRGIRSNDFGVGTDPAVGLYIDGVYSSRSGASITAFDDVEQIEVLKGPQGTLLGRNSPAGAISITTNKPSDKYEGEIALRVGDHGDRRLSGMINIPLTDTLDFRASGVLFATNGYFKDAQTGANLEKQSEWNGKAAFRWRPDQDTDAILTWRHDTLNGAPPASVNVSPLVKQPNSISFLYPALRPVFPYNPATLTDPVNTPFASDLQAPHQKRHLDDVTLSLTHDFGFFTATSLTNYHYFRTDNNESEDGTSLPYLYFATDAKEKNRQFYQELKFNHADEHVDVVAGASYYREMADQERYVEGNTSTLDVAAFNTQGVAPFYTIDELLSGAGLGFPYTKFENQPWTEATINNGAHNSAYAGFADVIWHALPKFDLTAGVRFTHDSKDYSWEVPARYAPGIDAAIASLGGQQALTGILTQVLEGTGAPPPYAAGTAAALVAATQNNFAYRTQAAYGRYFTASNSWNNISPRVVADYELAKHMHVYASFSEGYKAGGFNSQQPPTPAGAVLSGADAFSPEKMYNYELGTKTLFPEIGLQVNAALFHYKYNNRQNIEFVQPCSTCIDEYVTQTEDDQANGLDLDLLYMPIDNLQFGFNGTWIDATVAQPGVTLPGTVPVIKGQPTGEPSISFIFSVAYTVNLTDTDSLRFDLNHAYRGEGRCNNHTYSGTVVSSCNEPLPFDTNKVENTTDLRATFLTERGKYKISAFVNNVFDNRWTTYIGGDGVDTLGTPTAEISAPRTFGMDLTAKF